MNKKQYNNVIDWTLKHEQSAQTDDSLATARAIFDNMGIALPQGDIKTVYETISTDDYMGWHSCTMQEAQAAADKGTAAIGISEDKIVVLSATDEEQPVAQTASVMALDENTSAFAVDGLQYYSYSYGRTGQGGGSTTINYGCGGEYRYVFTEEPNCFGYALFLDYEINPAIANITSNKTSDYIDAFILEIRALGRSCRVINNFKAPIDSWEYRIAIRAPFDPDKNGNYHVIYQLSDGTWAGKDHENASQHFGNKNPTISPEMWSNDDYSPDAGTIYLAVTRW